LSHGIEGSPLICYAVEEMTGPTFLEQLGDERARFGTLITMPSPETAEVMSMVGFDWLWIDLEHGHIGLETLLHMLQSIRPPCHGIVRIPAADPIWIKRVLDLGCENLIVPQVNTAEEAGNAVSWSKYPPLGVRSVGMSRAHGYGMKFEEYVEHINERLAVFVQVEHVVGVQNVEAIAGVDGVSGILVGPYDLSASMGKIGRVGDDDVIENIEQIKRVCRTAGKPLGIFAANVETARRYAEEGFSFVSIGTDTLFMSTGAREALDRLRSR
jgi:2-dehydro-3-deoxyglucarate aldolase/4-hydroxy-2-oxoheptanedioate aldolase